MSEIRPLSKTAFGQILQLLAPYRWHVLLSIILVLLPSYFTLWSPYIVGRLIDDGLINKDTHVLVSLGLLILSIKVLLFFMNSLVTYCLSAFGLQILVDYRDRLLDRILHYPISFFDKVSSGSLTTRLTTDINAVQELFSTALVQILGNLFLIVGVMGAMLFIDWKLALCALSIVPLLIWLTAVFDVRIRRRFGFMRKTMSSLNSFAGETFSGSRDIRVLGALPGIESEFSSFSERLKTRFTRAVREYALFNPLVPFLTAIMDVIVLGVGGWRVFHGQMTVGEIVAFLGYASVFAWPIRDFAEKYTVLQQALAAVDRLVEVSNHEPEMDSGTRRLLGPAKIEFRAVEFAYAGSAHPAISDVSFSAMPGERIALMGETGSGKTTTCSLIMRFYQPQKGEIIVNGEPINSYSLDDYRSQVGWVSQDVFLFSASLRENLAFHSNVTDAEIWEALEIVQLKRWAENLPDRLGEIFKERASSLSSGQRQLLSLARAILRQPKILIFDEATSYIDSLTELMIQKALAELWASEKLKETTSFFIAHRLSTLKRCDRMLVFKSGRIVESGTYETLMALNGYAASLYREQFLSLRHKVG